MNQCELCPWTLPISSTVGKVSEARECTFSVCLLTLGGFPEAEPVRCVFRGVLASFPQAVNHSPLASHLFSRGADGQSLTLSCHRTLPGGKLIQSTPAPPAKRLLRALSATFVLPASVACAASLRAHQRLLGSRQPPHGQTASRFPASALVAARYLCVQPLKMNTRQIRSLCPFPL